MRRVRMLLLASAAAVCGAWGGPLDAQLGIAGSLSARAAVEQYEGDFSPVTVPLVDSAESVFAGASEWVFLLGREFAHSNRRFTLTADGALRQFTTSGFRQGNYSPREYSFSLQSLYQELVEAGTLTLDARVDMRGLTDLTPMPLYLAPGYVGYSLDAGYSRPVTGDTDVDAHVRFDERNYAGPSVLPTLDYLDRRSFEVQTGGRRLFRGAPDTRDFTTMRLFAAYLHSRYHLQGHRRDHALRLGGEWYLDRWDTWGLRFTLNASGVVNRSNSSRVEYNAARVEATARQRAGRYLLQLKGIWSGKSYVSPQEFLVPGEEADNAAILDGEITRFLGAGIAASLGGSWTRAETNISGDYYQRVRVYFGLLKTIRF